MKAGILIDSYKLYLFEKTLKEHNYTYQVIEDVKNTTILIEVEVEVENVPILGQLIEKTNRLAQNQHYLH